MQPSFYRTTWLTTAGFAAAILPFLLPFVDVRCNGMTLAQIRGSDMVTGSSPRLAGEFGDMTDALERPTNSTARVQKTSPDKGKVYPVAIAALLLGVAGLALSLAKKRNLKPAEMAAGVLGAVPLIALMIQVKSDVEREMDAGGRQSETMGAVKISVDFTIWFYLCLLSYLAAAWVAWQQKRLQEAGELPPEGAPQLPSQNPGDQSDFPAAPTGGQDLG